MTRGELAGAVRAWLAHPLLLLAAGALLSSYVIPLLTRSWQNHEKELELKTGLVTEINEKVTGFVMLVQAAELLPPETEVEQRRVEDELNAAYRRWETDSAVIGSKLRAYFPDGGLNEDWVRFSRAVSEFYSLVGIADSERRLATLATLKSRLDAIEVDDEIQDTVDSEKRALVHYGLGPERFRWAEARADLLGRKDGIVQRILKGDTAVF